MRREQGVRSASIRDGWSRSGQMLGTICQVASATNTGIFDEGSMSDATFTADTSDQGARQHRFSSPPGTTECRAAVRTSPVSTEPRQHLAAEHAQPRGCIRLPRRPPDRCWRARKRWLRIRDRSGNRTSCLWYPCANRFRSLPRRPAPRQVDSTSSRLQVTRCVAGIPHSNTCAVHRRCRPSRLSGSGRRRSL